MFEQCFKKVFKKTKQSNEMVTVNLCHGRTLTIYGKWWALLSGRQYEQNMSQYFLTFLHCWNQTDFYLFIFFCVCAQLSKVSHLKSYIFIAGSTIFFPPDSNWLYYGH